MYSDTLDRMRLGLSGLLERFWCALERGETVVIYDDFWSSFDGGF